MCGQQTRPVQNYRRKPRKFNKKLHQVEDSKSDSCENYYDTIRTVTTEFKKHIYATMNVGKTPIRFQVDSGASRNVIPVSKLDECGIHYILSTTSTVLTTYDKTSLKLVNPKTKKSYHTEFVVVKTQKVPILGGQLIQEMNLVTIHYDNILVMTDDTLTELDCLAEKEIIAPVTEPTPWVNNLVILEKPNK